jgi:GT2 family glycosyltransferase
VTVTVDASVIIPALDAAETLPAQLTALGSQDFDGEFEIIVADNGSQDATRGVVAQMQSMLPQLRVVDASDVGGSSHARNVGAASAQASTLLFCDADDVVAAGWCSGLITGLREFDAVGGAIDFFELNPDLPGRSGDNPLMRRLDRWPGYLPFAWSSNFGIRAPVFHAIEGFDESFAGAVDNEISFRLQQRGYTLGFASGALVHQRVRASTRARLKQQFRYATNEPHLYRLQREFGMPRGTPLHGWLGSIVMRGARALQHPTNPGARQISLDSVARFMGLLVGSIRYRTWFLGPR